MRLKDKLLIAILVILSFVVFGAVMCTYYSTSTLDLVLVGLLGVLVFVTVGAIACSYSSSRIAKQNNN